MIPIHEIAYPYDHRIDPDELHVYRVRARLVRFGAAGFVLSSLEQVEGQDIEIHTPAQFVETANGH